MVFVACVKIYFAQLNLLIKSQSFAFLDCHAQTQVFRVHHVNLLKLLLPSFASSLQGLRLAPRFHMSGGLGRLGLILDWWHASLIFLYLFKEFSLVDDQLISMLSFHLNVVWQRINELLGRHLILRDLLRLGSNQIV